MIAFFVVCLTLTEWSQKHNVSKCYNNQTLLPISCIVDILKNTVCEDGMPEYNDTDSSGSNNNGNPTTNSPIDTDEDDKYETTDPLYSIDYSSELEETESFSSDEESSEESSSEIYEEESSSEMDEYLTPINTPIQTVQPTLEMTPFITPMETPSYTPIPTPGPTPACELLIDSQLNQNTKLIEVMLNDEDQLVVSRYEAKSIGEEYLTVMSYATITFTDTSLSLYLDDMECSLSDESICNRMRTISFDFTEGTAFPSHITFKLIWNNGHLFGQPTVYEKCYDPIIDCKVFDYQFQFWNPEGKIGLDAIIKDSLNRPSGWIKSFDNLNFNTEEESEIFQCTTKNEFLICKSEQSSLEAVMDITLDLKYYTLQGYATVTKHGNSFYMNGTFNTFYSGESEIEGFQCKAISPIQLPELTLGFWEKPEEISLYPPGISELQNPGSSQVTISQLGLFSDFLSEITPDSIESTIIYNNIDAQYDDSILKDPTSLYFILDKNAEYAQGEVGYVAFDQKCSFLNSEEMYYDQRSKQELNYTSHHVSGIFSAKDINDDTTECITEGTDIIWKLCTNDAQCHPVWVKAYYSSKKFNVESIWFYFDYRANTTFLKTQIILPSTIQIQVSSTGVLYAYTTFQPDDNIIIKNELQPRESLLVYSEKKSYLAAGKLEWTMFSSLKEESPPLEIPDGAVSISPANEWLGSITASNQEPGSVIFDGGYKINRWDRNLILGYSWLYSSTGINQSYVSEDMEIFGTPADNLMYIPFVYGSKKINDESFMVSGEGYYSAIQISTVLVSIIIDDRMYYVIFANEYDSGFVLPKNRKLLVSKHLDCS